MIDLKKHTSIALGYFFLVGLLGLFLRLFFVTSVPANYRYFVHAHSHIALLGWVYVGLTTLIYKLYFSDTKKAPIYRRIFWFTQITLLGMLATFPFQGYALFSIIFSTLFLVASYFFAWFVFKNIPEHFKKNWSFKCIKAALWYMIFSSIGPWALGGIMSTLGSTSIWYKLAIYFYLHFQYNGWFILTLIGVLFYFLEKHDLMPENNLLKRFYVLINSSIILTFFLSVLWTEPHFSYYLLAGAGAVFQVWAFFNLFRMLKERSSRLQKVFSPFTGFLLKLAAVFLVVKILMQLISAIPYFADLAFRYNDFVIGYLHWVFLGVISIALFAFLKATGLMRISRFVFGIYLTGFILSEILLFYRGSSLWLRLPFFEDHFITLLVVSSLLPISVGIILFRTILTKK